MPRRTLALLSALSLLPSAACYDYIPARASPSTLVGQSVELALTDSGSVIEASKIGPQSTAIGGRYLGDSAGYHLVAASFVRRRGADPAPWSGERLAIARPLVSSVNVRRLSNRRTALVTVGVVAGVFAARAAIQGLGGSNAGANNSGGTGGAK